MKKKTRGILALLLACTMGAAVFAACGGETETPPEGNGSETPVDPFIGKTVELTALQESITIKDYEVSSYDFTSLFSLIVEGEETKVESSYIDASRVFAQRGSYTVVCSAGGKTATVSVIVNSSVCNITLSKEEVTVRQALWNSYDYLSLFSATLDGKPLELTEEMAVSDVRQEVGTYSYTVTFFKTSKTLTVHITDAQDIEIIPSCNEPKIEVSAIKDYDFKNLFSLYVNGEAVRVTDDMLTVPSLNGVKAGDSIEVTLTHTAAPTTAHKTLSVKVVPDEEVIVNAKNIVTYPNSGYIDLVSLFEVTKGGKPVQVTGAMIEGEIDYTKAGTNNVVLSYGNAEYTATVTVKDGVVINAAEEVIIKRGTSKNTYIFANDFAVVINGIRFYDIAESYFTGIDEADFDTEGEYSVKLTIPYNYKPMQWGQVNFENTEKEITYIVRAENYTVSVKQDLFEVPAGAPFDYVSNVELMADGQRRTLTTDRDSVGVLSRYAELVSEFDPAEMGVQEVRVNVYAYGLDNDPIPVTYRAVVQSDIKITAMDAAVFAGVTLYTKDLFTITAGGTNVEVTYDMLSGKVDTFTSGIYTVTVDYRGIVKEAKVTVLDNALKGTFRTLLTTIPDEDDDEDVDGDVGWGSGSEYYSVQAYAESAASTRLSNLIIDEDGSMRIGDSKLIVLGSIDENTMRVGLGSDHNVFTLYYHDGIVVLDPENSLKMTFTNYRRPMIYFNSDVWSIRDYVQINSLSGHILRYDYAGYTIDTFRLVSKDETRELWYGLKTQLVYHMNSDTEYRVSWGEVEYAQGFVPEEGISSYAVFDGDTYSFSMQSAGAGKVSKNTAKEYAGMSFSGTVNGQKVRLTADSGEGFTITWEDSSTTVVSSYNMSSLKNGGSDYQNGTVFLYGYPALDKHNFTEPFSYKFKVDKETKTFEYLERDIYWGVYEADNSYIWLDGYGTGSVSFNTSSYSTTQFTYTVKGNEIYISYLDILPTFEYGAGATFYINPLLNVLTLKQNDKGTFKDTVWKNGNITDGAVIDISSYFMAADSTQNAKANFLKLITIRTKDGEVTDKNDYVDTQFINFGKSGFYYFTVTVEVGGKPVTCNYAVQILGAAYTGNPLLGTYESVLSGGYKISVNEYGMASITLGEVVYSGLATLAEDGFTVRARSGNDSVTAVATVIENGILNVRISGSANLNDYFTVTGATMKVAGCKILENLDLLRVITVGEKRLFIWANAVTSMGTIVGGEIVEGSLNSSECVIRLTDEEGETLRYVQVKNWGDLESGLTVLTGYNG